jgi:hypothetical protein
MYIHNPHKDLRSFMAGPVTMNCKTDGISSISGKEYRKGERGTCQLLFTMAWRKWLVFRCSGLPCVARRWS